MWKWGRGPSPWPTEDTPDASFSPKCQCPYGAVLSPAILFFFFFNTSGNGCFIFFSFRVNRELGMEKGPGSSCFLTQLCVNIWVGLWGGWHESCRKYPNLEAWFTEKIAWERKVSSRQMIESDSYQLPKEYIPRTFGHLLAFFFFFFNLGLIFSLFRIPVLCLRMDV